MQLQTKYITPDEFTEYFGINLYAELEDDANPSDKVLRFLKRIENRMESFIDAKFNRNINMLYPEFTDYQKEHYKLALLEQAIYVFKNGDISTDSGYDPEEGEKSSIGKLQEKVIAPNAKNELILCGLWNRNIPDMATGILTGNWFKGY